MIQWEVRPVLLSAHCHRISTLDTEENLQSILSLKCHLDREMLSFILNSWQSSGKMYPFKNNFLKGSKWGNVEDDTNLLLLSGLPLPILRVVPETRVCCSVSIDDDSSCYLSAQIRRIFQLFRVCSVPARGLDWWPQYNRLPTNTYHNILCNKSVMAGI